MTVLSLPLGVWRLIEGAAALVAAPVVGLALIVWMRTTRPRGQPFRRVVLVLSSIAVARPKSAEERETNRILYRHPHTAYSIAVHTVGARFVGRLASGVGAVNLPRAPAAWVRAIAPAFARLYEEAAAILTTFALVRRLRPAIIEYLGPSLMAPRAWLIATCYPGKLMTQVRGNIDLLNQVRGHASLIRSRRRFWLFVGAQVDKFIYALAYNRCDLVLGYSVNTFASALSNGADPRRTRNSRIYIHDSILHPPPPRPRAELADLPQDGRMAMIWGRLGAEKAVREAVLGTLPVMARHGDLRLVVIGEGPERARIEADIAAAGLDARAHFIGWRDRAYIASAVRHADVALMPLSGSALAEAALLEVPILAFDIEWHGEIVTNGETGVLADYPNSAHWADCLEELLSDPARARAMARAARARALRLFDRETIRVREERLMRELLADLPARIP